MDEVKKNHLIENSDIKTKLRSFLKRQLSSVGIKDNPKFCEILNKILQSKLSNHHKFVEKWGLIDMYNEIYNIIKENPLDHSHDNNKHTSPTPTTPSVIQFIEMNRCKHYGISKLQ